MLGGGGVDRLEPVKAGVLSEQGAAQFGEDSFAGAAGGEVTGDDPAGVIDATSPVPAGFELVEVMETVAGEASRRNVMPRLTTEPGPLGRHDPAFSP